MCSKAADKDGYTLAYVSDDLKTIGMSNEAMPKNLAALFLVPDCFKTQKMCSEAGEVDPW